MRAIKAMPRLLDCYRVSEKETSSEWDEQPIGLPDLNMRACEQVSDKYQVEVGIADPVSLPIKKALGLQQDLLVCLVLRDAVGEVRCVSVHLSRESGLINKPAGLPYHPRRPNVTGPQQETEVK